MATIASPKGPGAKRPTTDHSRVINGEVLVINGKRTWYCKDCKQFITTRSHACVQNKAT